MTHRPSPHPSQHAARVLRDSEDALGQMYRDFLADRAGPTPLLERGDGHVGTALGADVFFAGYDAWPPEERSVFDAVRGRVLDVGCGAGRHCLTAQDRGLEVVGIDISPGAVQVCRRRGVHDARLLPLSGIDAHLGRFDTVLMMCGNFGLPGTATSTTRFLELLHGMTTNGGRIILDSDDPYREPDQADLAYMAQNQSNGRMPGQVTIRLRYGVRVTPWFDLLCVSPTELEQIASRTGWRISALVEGEPPTFYAVLDKVAGPERPL
jgi:SAM-dependent methyltransferase